MKQRNFFFLPPPSISNVKQIEASSEGLKKPQTSCSSWTLTCIPLEILAPWFVNKSRAAGIIYLPNSELPTSLDSISTHVLPAFYTSLPEGINSLNICWCINMYSAASVYSSHCPRTWERFTSNLLFSLWFQVRCGSSPPLKFAVGNAGDACGGLPSTLTPSSVVTVASQLVQLKVSMPGAFQLNTPDWGSLWEKFVASKKKRNCWGFFFEGKTTYLIYSKK